MIYTGRGSTALWVLLQILDRSGGRILVPANICEIVVAVILKAGWQPVFCDVNPVTGNAELAEMQAAWSPDVSCVLAVPNFGTPLDMAAIEEWARAKHVFLIVDVCNAIGADISGRACSEFGDAAVYSFGYTKIIEHRTGGGLVVRDPAIEMLAEAVVAAMPVYNDAHARTNAERQAELRQLRTRPESQTASVYRPLYDRYADDLWYRIDETDIEAIEQLRSQLSANLERRRAIAAVYQRSIHGGAAVLRPVVDGDVYWRFTFTVPRTMRQQIIDAVRAEGLLASAWYPPVPHLFMPGASAMDYPNAEAFGASVINLFTDHRVDAESAEQAAMVVNRFA